MRTLSAGLLFSAAALAASPSPVVVAPGFVEMQVRTVTTIDGAVAVLLVPKNGEELVLPIFIGEAEASAIQQRLSHTHAIRPMTHDLLETMIKTLNGKV